MKGKTQADRLATMMQKHRVYDHYSLALPLIEVKSGMLRKLKEEDVLLLGWESIALVLLEKERIWAELLPLGTQGSHFEVTVLEDQNESMQASSKHQVVTLVLDTIERKRLKTGDIINLGNVEFDKIDIYANDKKIAQGSLINVDGKIGLQIDKVKEIE